MKQLWTTLADRRRAGPPAFRRKYSQMPNATLSFSLGGRLFLGNFGTLGAGRGPLRPPSQALTLNSQNPKYGLVLESEPYDFFQTFWGATYSEMIRKRRRQLFSGLPVCGDIPPFWPVQQPKLHFLDQNVTISFERLVVAPGVWGTLL